MLSHRTPLARAARLRAPILGLLAGLGLAASAAAQPVSIATLPPGSVFHTMGSVMAAVVKQKGDMNALVQPYGGTPQMVTAVDRGEADFVLLDANDARWALNGQQNYDGKPRKNIRVAIRLLPVPIGLLVRADSGINAIGDLKGKRIPTGWAAFPAGWTMTNALLAGGGLTEKDINPVPVPALIPAIDDFAAGKIDTAMFAIGAPKIAEVDQSTGGVRYLPFPNTPEAIAAARKIRPLDYVIPVKPAPHLAGVKAEIPMLTWDTVIMAGTHVPDETVAKFIKTLAVNKPALVQGFPGLGPFNPQAMAKAFPDDMPYHPGAIAAYKDLNQWPPK